MINRGQVLSFLGWPFPLGTKKAATQMRGGFAFHIADRLL